jgi:formate dehydrogenase
VLLTTRGGTRRAVVEVSDAMQPGHLALPNGLGLTLEDGVTTGVGPNELTRAADRDPWVGTPWHKHVPARVERAEKVVARL